jgi:alkyl hydroperoxide reductase subunit D
MSVNQGTSDFIEALLETRTSAIARDLKLNFRRLTEESALSPEESSLALLAIATSVNHRPLIGHAREKLVTLGIPADQIQEASESAAMMGMLNIYYRFRHMVETPENQDDYKTANLRMTSMARPAMGKEKYEMLAFAVSVINGCSNCVKAHEKVLRDSGVSVEKVHDLARLASVINGLKALETSG